MVTEQAVIQALSTVQDPEIHRDLVSLNMVRDIRVEGANVSVEVVLTTPACPLRTQIERECRDALGRIPGVGRIDIRMGAKVAAARPTAGPGGIPGVKNIIAVASGKGGVGKSTVSVNLAVALAEAGASVGLLDADVYGPSIPLMMGIHRMPEMTDEQRIIPLEAHGVKLMSLGFVLPTASTPVIWRGPMITKTLNQFLRQVNWEELDYLLIDLPPRTGDAQLTLSQTLTMSSVVIVMTPQDVAMTIASRVLVMFRNMKVPILGIVENMSYFTAPNGDRIEIFGHGGGRKEAERIKTPFLGEVPIFTEIREGGDRGVPIVVSSPDKPAGQAFLKVAEALRAKLG
jgi:ATP-binding protein involved in chromosome partitioning